MDQGCRGFGGRRGFTLIELLVVVFLVGLLVALLMPAVQAAREAARRSFCANNLRQIGLGLHQYESSFRVLPPGTGARRQSLFVAILPALDHAPLYSGFNFHDAVDQVVNQTVREVRIATFSCPSDDLSSAAGVSNYAGNSGDIGRRRSTGLFDFSIEGAASSRRPADCIGLAEITDGLANTSAICEWLVYPRGDEDLGDPARDVYLLPEGPIHRSDDPDEFARHCLGATRFLLDAYPKGAFWFLGGRMLTLYDHGGPPNAPSCYPTHDGWAFLGSCTVASRHPSGVNALMADGHLRTIGREIDPALWRSLGTRSGSELTYP